LILSPLDGENGDRENGKMGENGDSALFLEEKIGRCPHFPPFSHFPCPHFPKVY